MQRRSVWVGLTLTEQTVSHHLGGSGIACLRDLKLSGECRFWEKHSSDSYPTNLQVDGGVEARAAHQSALLTLLEYWPVWPPSHDYSSQKTGSSLRVSCKVALNPELQPKWKEIKENRRVIDSYLITKLHTVLTQSCCLALSAACCPTRERLVCITWATAKAW